MVTLAEVIKTEILPRFAEEKYLRVREGGFSVGCP